MDLFSGLSSTRFGSSWPLKEEISSLIILFLTSRNGSILKIFWEIYSAMFLMDTKTKETTVLITGTHTLDSLICMRTGLDFKTILLPTYIFKQSYLKISIQSLTQSFQFKQQSFILLQLYFMHLHYLEFAISSDTEDWISFQLLFWLSSIMNISKSQTALCIKWLLTIESLLKQELMD